MLIKFPPTLSEYQERYLKGDIHEWCITNGVVLRNAGNPSEAHTIPVTMYPTPFSRHGFETALKIQKSFNSLYYSVVKQPELVLDELLQASGTEDVFTLRLIDIYKHTIPRRTQTLTGGLFRSDYLVDKARTNTDEGRQIKQVEFNTVSVSFGGLSSKVTSMHRFMAEAAKNSVHGEIPVSDSLHKLAEGLALMHKSYDAGDMQTMVLVVVQPGETNVVDQKLLEYELFNKHGIISVRATLEQISRKTTIGENNRLIFVPNGAEISVVYFRSGYGPNDYPTEVEWLARERLESSHAIQCPSVLTQLSGTKKIQQLLTEESFLKKLKLNITSEDLAQLQKTFVKIWPLDSESSLGQEGQRLALEEPERFVLKPQREGGGNNVYREDIPSFLQTLDPTSWSNYILMELIEPPKVSNKIVRGDEIASGRIVSELGVFGTVLWDLKTGKELVNEEAGFLLRTKLQSSNEGGIAAGFGCLDAVMLPSR